MEIIKKLQEFEEKTHYFNAYIKIYPDGSGRLYYGLDEMIFAFYDIENLIKKIDEHIADLE